jgi:voltage-gated sodium channel
MNTPSVPGSGWLVRLRYWTEHPRTQNLIMALILINAVVLGLETSAAAMARFGDWLIAIDQAILAVFVVEIAARLLVHRGRFFRDPWSLFDFTVVVIALIPASGPLSVLRALRVLRVLRLLTVVPSLRRVVGALLAAVPGLSSIAAVLALIFYVFAVIATKIFGAAFPDWFGTLGASIYTLFQVMTLESWSMGISRPVMEQFPMAWLFFIPFILVATFTMLNLFIAVIVNAMQSFSSEDQQATQTVVEQARDHVEADLHAEMRALRGELSEMKTLLRTLTAQPAGGRVNRAPHDPPQNHGG